MKRWLMEILACPQQNCRSKLHLKVLSSHKEEVNGEEHEEIDEALITCPKCGRWYPVIDGIACMLPDDFRLTGKQRAAEQAFLKRWQEYIDPEILEHGKPFGLNLNEQT